MYNARLTPISSLQSNTGYSIGNSWDCTEPILRKRPIIVPDSGKSFNSLVLIIPISPLSHFKFTVNITGLNLIENLKEIKIELLLF